MQRVLFNNSRYKITYEVIDNEIVFYLYEYILNNSLFSCNWEWRFRKRISEFIFKDTIAKNRAMLICQFFDLQFNTMAITAVAGLILSIQSKLNEK